MSDTINMTTPDQQQQQQQVPPQQHQQPPMMQQQGHPGQQQPPMMMGQPPLNHMGQPMPPFGAAPPQMFAGQPQPPMQGMPPPFQGGFAPPPQQGFPPMQMQQGGFAPPGAGGFPPMVGTVAPVAQPDTDYFKGFYEGVTRASTTNFGTAMSWVGPLAVNMVLFLGPIWYIRRRAMQQMGPAAAGDPKKGMSAMMDMMNPLKAKKYKVEVKGTKFDDVIGIQEAKEDLKQYVDFLADPKKFTRLGARLPKGCLLTGQPGTGKTLLARAIAGEADRPFLSCSGADFIEMFGGSGPKRVRELFAEAKEAAPCVVFIDEIDAIGSRNAGRSMGGGSSEENRTINQLLAELDGLASKEAIVVVAATNYPDNIDKALLREGRFDRKVNIPMPDFTARSEMFRHYLKGVVTGDKECEPKIITIKKRDEKKDGDSAEAKKEEPKKQPTPVIIDGVSNEEYAKALSERTPGVSPAQISTIVNEAALACAVAEEKAVTLKALQDAIDDVLVGKKHRQRMSGDSLKRTSYHECGHAIMSWTNPLQKDVVKISIIPRGRAGGYTQQVQDEALDPQTDEFLFSQLCVLLGGRVAERIILGDISTGAVDDLQRATKIAMDKLLSYGMSQEVGLLAFKPNDKNDGRAWMNYSEALHAQVEAEARKLVDKAYEHTFKTLTENNEKLHSLAMTLLEKKELMKPDVEAILGARPKKIVKVPEAEPTKSA